MKKSKTILKVIFIFLILLSIVVLFSNKILAWDMQGQLNAFQEVKNGKDDNIGHTVTNVVGAVINLVSIIGAGIAVIMLVVLGIQYITSGGGEKANVKKDLNSYVMGAVILFGVSGILKLLQIFIDKNLNNV